MGLYEGQANCDELAEELEDLLRRQHVLLPDDVLHPDSGGGVLAGLEELGDVPAHLAQLQLPAVPQQLYPRDGQLEQRLALGGAEAAAAAAAPLAEEGVQHRHGGVNRVEVGGSSGAWVGGVSIQVATARARRRRRRDRKSTV